jgi:hypothetical protein
MSNVQQTSSITTSAVTFSATALVPAIQWAAAGFPQPVPDGVAILIGAALVSLGHAAYNTIQSRLAAKNPNPFLTK